MNAYVTKVSIGLLTIDGLMDQSGNYFVAVPQMVALNLVPPNRSQKQLERLVGVHFKTHKLKTEFSRHTTSCVPLRDFEVITFELALKGNSTALTLLRSLFGLSLQQLFCDAFSVRFEAEDRHNWLVERAGGQDKRRCLTDAIHDYLSSQGQGDARGYYAQITNKIYQGIFNLDAYQIRQHLRVPDHHLTRDYLNNRELRTIATIEEIVMNMIDNGTYPFDAVQDAFGIMATSRVILVGK